MTTTKTKYKKGKKKRKEKKKKISADLQDLRYKINYTTYNTMENDLFTQHYVGSFLIIILPTNLTLQCVDLLFL